MFETLFLSPEHWVKTGQWFYSDDVGSYFFTSRFHYRLSKNESWITVISKHLKILELRMTVLFMYKIIFKLQMLKRGKKSPNKSLRINYSLQDDLFLASRYFEKVQTLTGFSFTE